MKPMPGSNRLILGLPSPVELRHALDGWRRGTGPLYQRLAEALADAAERGELLPGTRLPPERDLAVHLGVARTTVSAAYKQLELRGLVARRQGRGTHVTGAEGAEAGARAAELTTSLQRNVLFRRLGEDPADAVDLLSICEAPGPAVREVLTSAGAAVNVGELADEHGYLPLGYPPLRRAVAAHLTARGLVTDAEEILITAGAQQALSLLASYYVTPGAMVVVEDPTFPGAIDAFRTAGARILTVPVGQAGTDVGLLAATISQSQVRAVYLMPTFHNPTGCVVPTQARRELAQLSQITGIPFIEDNTLAELALGNEPPLPLAAYARGAQIASVGSLSKVFWAGLRVGWIRGPRPVIAQLGRLKAVTDLGTSLVSQAIAVNLLADADRVWDLRRRELAERLALLQDLLGRHLPDWSWRPPGGGLCIWARLPDGSSTELAQIASRHGVLIAPGSVMSPAGRFDEHIRLPFDYRPAKLEQGVRRLSRAWRAYRGVLDAQGPQRIDVIV
jgi:DNA-binding transcriptional MocR family regulator